MLKEVYMTARGIP